MPFVGVGRPASEISTEVVGSTSSTVQFESTNTADVGGTIDVYAVGSEDPYDGMGDADIKAVGIQTFDYTWYPPIGSHISLMATTTHHPMSNVGLNEWDVLIDTEGNGSWDYVVVGVHGALLGDVRNLMYSLTIDLSTGGIVDIWAWDATLNGATTFTLFVPELLGLDPTGVDDHDMVYMPVVYSLLDSARWDYASPAKHDFADTAVEAGIYGPVAAHSSVQWEAGYDFGHVKADKSAGWMIVSIENEGGAAEAQIIGVPRQNQGRGGGSGGPRGPGGPPQ